MAHRPNAITHCNKLLVIDQGELRVFGPREEVLSKIMPKPANVATIHPRTESNG